MIKKLSVDQQKTIYGGNYYSIFDDGYVLVVISSNERYLYPDWEKAKLKHRGLLRWMIKPVTSTQLILREDILRFSHISPNINQINK